MHSRVTGVMTLTLTLTLDSAGGADHGGSGRVGSLLRLAVDMGLFVAGVLLGRRLK